MICQGGLLNSTTLNNRRNSSGPGGLAERGVARLAKRHPIRVAQHSRRSQDGEIQAQVPVIRRLANGLTSIVKSGKPDLCKLSRTSSRLECLLSEGEGRCAQTRWILWHGFRRGLAS